MEYIETIGYNKFGVAYVRIGTIGWLKTKKNEVRQCRLEKVTFDYKDCHNWFTCEWKVAGFADIMVVKGSGWNTIEGVGVIYTTKEEAEHGSANTLCNNSRFAPNATINIYEKLVERYGEFSTDKIEFDGCWRDCLSITTILMKKNGTMPLWRHTPFNVVADKNGVRVTIPLVDMGDAFLTKEAALATYEPLPIFTFDDEVEKKTFTIKAEAVFSRTIEVKADTYEKAVELAKNVLRKDNFNDNDNNGTQFF
jgi:hypothetical protein